MFQFAGFALPDLCIQSGVTQRAGFPHSEICGSKLICQLPAAYRRLSRLSSPVIAKASTTCTCSLDPIALHTVSCDPVRWPQALTRLPYLTQLTSRLHQYHPKAISAPNDAIFKPNDLCTTPHPCMSSTYRSTSSTLLKNIPAPQVHWQLDTDDTSSTYLPSP